MAYTVDVWVFWGAHTLTQTKDGSSSGARTKHPTHTENLTQRRLWWCDQPNLNRVICTGKVGSESYPPSLRLVE